MALKGNKSNLAESILLFYTYAQYMYSYGTQLCWETFVETNPTAKNIQEGTLK